MTYRGVGGDVLTQGDVAAKDGGQRVACLVSVWTSFPPSSERV